MRRIEGRSDAAQQSVTLVTIHAAKGLEWPVVIPINTMGRPQNEGGIFYDYRSNCFSTNWLGISPTEHSPIQSWVAAEEDRERVRLWYVAVTRARDLLVLPRHTPELAAGSWGQIVDLRLALLPAVEPVPSSNAVSAPAEPMANSQTREVFTAEAERIVGAERHIGWLRPSRDEDDMTDVAEPPVIVGSTAAEQTERWPVSPIAGGAIRGTVLHKLLEEVLTGETAEDQVSLRHRATELLSELSIEKASDPKYGIAPEELAATVLQTLALPELAALRPRLVPESVIHAAHRCEEKEVLVAGIADAVAVDCNGAIEAVIDWKSDTYVNASILKSYQRQVRAYCKATGANRGMLVFMSHRRVIECCR